MLGLVALARSWALPWPRCGLRLLTGLPCPLCGSTRSLAAVAQLHWAEALAYNPLVVAVGAGWSAWFAAWAFNRSWAERWAARSWRMVCKRPWVLGLVVLANWLYLLRTLPP